MTDTEPARPRLVSVKDAGPADDAPATAAKQPEPAQERRPTSWLLLALVVAALIGFAVQTWRVQGLEASNARLTGELFSARSALDAYTERFAVVRETVAGLSAQLEALNALVSEDPVAAAPAEAAPEAAGTPVAD